MDRLKDSIKDATSQGFSVRYILYIIGIIIVGFIAYNIIYEFFFNPVSKGVGDVLGSGGRVLQAGANLLNNCAENGVFSPSCGFGIGFLIYIGSTAFLGVLGFVSQWKASKTVKDISATTGQTIKKVASSGVVDKNRSKAITSDEPGIEMTQLTSSKVSTIQVSDSAEQALKENPTGNTAEQLAREKIVKDAVDQRAGDIDAKFDLSPEKVKKADQKAEEVVTEHPL